jgi:hypothetical protein
VQDESLVQGAASLPRQEKASQEKEKQEVSATKTFRNGLILGFTHARDNPDQTLEQFISDVDSLQSQLEDLADWQLRLLAGKGNRMDHVRLTVKNWIDARGYHEKKPAPEDAGQS